MKPMDTPIHVRRSLPLLLSASGALLCLVGTWGLDAGAAIAQSRRQVHLNLPGLSAPGNRQSGSTRSESCLPEGESIVALMPTTNYGLTAAAYPTFFFYLPDTTAEVAQFVIYNEATLDVVYEGTFAIQGESGIVSVSLPDNGLQKALTEEESYFWYFSVVCDQEDPSASIVVEGTVARVAPPAALATALTTAPAAALPELYAEAGLWHDALAAAVPTAPSDDGETWAALLAAVDLNDLTDRPILSSGLETVDESAPEVEER